MTHCAAIILPRRAHFLDFPPFYLHSTQLSRHHAALLEGHDV